MSVEPQLLRKLLSRAGFGHDATLYARYLESGSSYENIVDDLLNFDSSGKDVELEALIEKQQLDFTNPDDIKRWWLFRMMLSPHPLQEKLTLFWHGHFATSIRKVQSAYAMYLQNRTIRRLCAGRFDDLLLAMSRDPAMIIWLDNQQNRKGKPNENYAREVMELFTLGIGNYSEDDVKEAARAFTGWHARRGVFYFDKTSHDSGVKVFLGESGNLDGVDIVRILSRRPETAHRLALKLLRYFCSEKPDKSLIEKISRVYLENHEIKPMLRAIFLSDAFTARKNFHTLVKSPCDFVVGTLNTLDYKVIQADTPRYLAAMGQDLFAPPSVKGWDGGENWIVSDTMMARFNFAARVVGERLNQLTDQKGLLTRLKIEDNASLVDYFATLLLDSDLTPQTRQRLLEYVSTDNKGHMIKEMPQGKALDAKIRGLLHLIMTLPGYQLI